MNKDQLVDIWRDLLGSAKSWVLFENGTCCVLPEPDTELSSQATALLRAQGPVHAGTPSADFDVIHPDDVEGWVVTCHHQDILTYVGPEDVESTSDLTIGIHGRANRDNDARDLAIIHVEDVRSAGA